MKEKLFEKMKRWRCPVLISNIFSGVLFGSDDKNHGNLIIVEVSAELMAPDETPLLGLAC
jgi:hypothetical protein